MTRAGATPARGPRPAPSGRRGSPRSRPATPAAAPRRSAPPCRASPRSPCGAARTPAPSAPTAAAACRRRGASARTATVAAGSSGSSTAQANTRGGSHTTTRDVVVHSPTSRWRLRPLKAAPTAGSRTSSSHATSCTSRDSDATRWMSLTNAHSTSGGADTWIVASATGPSAYLMRRWCHRRQRLATVATTAQAPSGPHPRRGAGAGPMMVVRRQTGLVHAAERRRMPSWASPSCPRSPSRRRPRCAWAPTCGTPRRSPSTAWKRWCSPTARTACAASPTAATTSASAAACPPPASRPRSRSARRGTRSSPARSARRSAREARAQGVAVVLGPGINIKRSPLCGRNFEYFSEDPHLAGRVAAGLVEGAAGRGGRAPASSTSPPTTRRPTGCGSAPRSTSARCARSTCPRSSTWSPPPGRGRSCAPTTRSTARTPPSTAGCSPRCCATSGASTGW